MATTTFSAAPSGLTNANFRLWGSQLSAALVAVGMILVECTGDIDWTTVTAPGAGVYAGWEVFRFSDTAQATHPVFFKLEYGTSTYAGNPGLRLTVGRGVNTADGTLTTPTTSAMAITQGGDNDTTTMYDCFVSGSTGRCNVIMFAGHITHLCFYIERTKDDNGNATDDAVNVVVVSNANLKQQLLPKIGSAFPVASHAPQCDMPPAGTGSWGTNIGFYPIKPNYGYAANPDLGGVLYFTGDLASVGALVTLTLFLTSHTFITAGYGQTGAVNGNATVKSIAMRYE